jgi:hypothetical protein
LATYRRSWQHCRWYFCAAGQYYREHQYNGEIYTVRCDAVNAMLLNEFLKEHRKNEEREAAIARQQKQIDALAVGLQTVSAQLELSRSAPPSVVNNQ